MYCTVWYCYMPNRESISIHKHCLFPPFQEFFGVYMNHMAAVNSQTTGTQASRSRKMWTHAPCTVCDIFR